MEINSLKPVLDPLIIIANINKREYNDDVDSNMIMSVNIDIISNSSLNNIMIMFFRHQHILIILIIIRVFMKGILEYSTSKVDIFVKLYRTYVNINLFSRDTFY